MNIAIIDDSDADRFLARRVLQTSCPRAIITEFESGQDALEPVREESRKKQRLVVFLDINMPRMSGFDFLDQVQRDIDTPPIYILMLTSSGAKADREQAEQYDCVKGFIEKPLTREHLEALAESLAESPE